MITVLADAKTQISQIMEAREVVRPGMSGRTTNVMMYF